nr:DUF2812 domain-containing protein [Bacillus sp. RO1]
MDLWQIAEQEAWLSDMATKGWELTKMNLLTAHFKKTPPQTITFKTDIFKEPINQNPDQLEQYEQAGWKYVASRGPLQFFQNNPESSVMELHLQPIQQAQTIILLRETIKISAFYIILLLLIGVFLAVTILTLNPVRNYLKVEFISPTLQILIFIGTLFTLIKGFIHLKRLIKILQSNKRIQPATDYRKKYLRNKIIGISLITFFTVVLIYQIINSDNTTGANSYPPIPNGELSVVQIRDITESNNYKPYFYDQNSNRENYYSVTSSLLVPEQYELNQLVEVEGEKWEGKSGPYRPSLTSRKYIVLNEFLAKRLFQHLIDWQKELHRGDAIFYKTAAFDEMVVLENSVLSRKDHIIYYVTYYGKEPVEKIINELELLIMEEKQRS